MNTSQTLANLLQALVLSPAVSLFSLQRQIPWKIRRTVDDCSLAFSYRNHVHVQTNAFQCNIIREIYNSSRMFGFSNHSTDFKDNDGYFFCSRSLIMFLSDFLSRQSSGTVIKNRYAYYTACTNLSSWHCYASEQPGLHNNIHFHMLGSKRQDKTGVLNIMW